jgi:hypothetical protein
MSDAVAGRVSLVTAYTFMFPLRTSGKVRPGFSLKATEDDLQTNHGDASGRLVGIGLQPGNQFIQVICRHRFPCKKNVL